MKINRVRYLKGPNYFNLKPTMWIELDIEEFEFQPSNKIPRFSEALVDVIPSLKTHTCSLGYEGGFVERLKEGTWMGHILEHITLELQSLAGIQVKRGKTITSRKKGIYFVTYDYKEPKSGYYAFKAAMELTERILKGERSFSIDSYVNNIAHLYYEHKLGPSTESIYEAAMNEHIPVERIGTDSMLRLGTGFKQKFVQATITSQTSQLAVENACDKQTTKLILESCGVPVPKGEVVSSTKEIFQAAKYLGFPLVIKPSNGRQGQGVMTNIHNEDELFNIVHYLFKDRKEAAIPIVSVTGTNGKTTTTRLVKHFLDKENRTVGMTNSDGVYIGDRCIDEGDCSGPISAKKVLSNPTVDMAVLETARGGILREGLAFRHCDVGIVTNVSEDHLGLDGIETFDQLVKLKRLITEVVIEDGYCILNADDEEVVRMAEYTKGQVIFTSLNEYNPHIQQAISSGGTAWFMDRNGTIQCVSAGEQIEFLPCRDIPITIEGTAKHNISNVLQALAAAYSLGVPLEELKEKALSFIPDFKLSKGRFNKVDVQGRQVIVDYAHNIAGLRAIFDTIEALKSNRVITALSAPGDRLDEDIRQLAKISANHSDILIIKEDDDLRGRAPYEAANIIRNVALKEKMEAKHAPIIRDELEAFKKAWELSKEGDLLLFLYTDFTYVKEFFSTI